MAYLFEANADWDMETLKATWEAIQVIAEEDMEFDYYPAQIEICTAEQMADCYASVGLPINYSHWSFGKEFAKTMDGYQKGQSGLALEMIINSNPSIAYCMEDNDMVEQALVMAHASVGHSHTFKNNYLFKQWTEPEAIINYMVFAKQYIKQCEERYGVEEVEHLLDSCHAIQNFGVDKYKRKTSHRMTEEARVLADKIEHEEKLQHYDDLFARTIPEKEKVKDETGHTFSPQENFLYFLEKKSPILKPWQREVVRICRKMATYFYPQQGQSGVVHEGAASFTHYFILTRLFEKGLISDGSYQKFLHSHTSVVFQPEYTSKWFSGFNKYALGFAIFMDIKRMCENPTEEDKEWFPDVVNTRWQDTIKYAIANHDDSSLITQYMSPKVIRDLKLFQISVDTEAETDEGIAVVTEIQDAEGYRNIRREMSENHRRINFIPDIQIVSANYTTDRVLTLEYFPYKNRPLNHNYAKKTIAHLQSLWGYPIRLICKTEDGLEQVLN
jgi:spore cortex formation protein SpoVR/YcgB (stage V sporulation)